MILFLSIAIPVAFLIELSWSYAHCKVRIVTNSCRAFQMGRRLH
jgi:hypothetical protein